MDENLRASPWHRRWWGVIILFYLAVTAVLGIIFLIKIRSTPAGLAGFMTALQTKKSAAPADETLSAASAQVMAALVGADPALGAAPDQAKFTIIEFADFQCPYCRQVFPTIREMAALYGERGLRIVYHNWFDESAHPHARPAAEAARCAHAQGKFWAYHDKLFQNQEALDVKSLAAYARQVGLDGQQFDVCLASRQFAVQIRQDLEIGQTLKVRGTPTWFMIYGKNFGRAYRAEGIITRESFIKLLDQVLKSPL